MFSIYSVSDSVREWAVTPPPKFAGEEEYQRTSRAVYAKALAAAERGERFAQVNLAHMLYHGRGVPANRLAALEWFRKAAEQGDAGAQLMLGHCLFAGEVVPLDHATAARWYARAAAQGDAVAQEMLARCHESGLGVPRNAAAAYHWFAMSAARGRSSAAASRDAVMARLTQAEFAEAQAMAGRVPVQSDAAVSKPSDELARLRDAAARNDAVAQNQLGVAYQNGVGVVQNLTEAARWYRLAAEQGSPHAQANLASLLSAGRGLSMDLVEAYQWFNLASAQGHRTATASREALAARMTAEEIRDAQRRSSEFLQRASNR